jgi:hypothetical protein
MATYMIVLEIESDTEPREDCDAYILNFRKTPEDFGQDDAAWHRYAEGKGEPMPEAYVSEVTAVKKIAEDES